MPTINNNLIIWNKMIENSISQQHLKKKSITLNPYILSSLSSISMEVNYSDNTVEKNLGTLK